MPSNVENIKPVFYTVREAAETLRVNPATLYRAIREDAFPAVRIRGRYVIPTAALDRLIADAADGACCIDPAGLLAERRTVHDAAHLTEG